ncbi:MAG: HAD-IA family hydrolase [Kofleriaceae bacterium]
MRRFRGALLDIDGTLVDSSDAHARAWKQAFEDYDFDVQELAIKRQIGMGSDHLIPTLTVVERGSRMFEKLTSRHDEIFADIHVNPVIGARAFVLRLRAEGYQIAVATSANAGLERLLKIADVADLLPARASASDVDSSKPDPDVVQAAVKKLPLYAYECVMIGDTPYDIAAARSAGVSTIAVGTGGFTHEALAGALAFYSSVSELAARWDSSPLA